MAIKIALANQKGGVGKTTSTIELGAYFKQKNYSVVVVDLEQQYDTTKYCGGNPTQPGIYEVLKGEIKVSDAIQHLEEFDLLSASPKLSKADEEFTGATDVLKLKKALLPLEEEYDFIIIDTNPGRNKLLNMAYVASDYVVIPTDADDGSVDGIKSVFADLEEFRSVGWSDSRVLGVIFTRTENTGMHKYQEDRIREILDEKQPDAFLMKVRKGIAATECKTEGTSMQMGKKFSNPAIDYRKVGEKALELILKNAE